MPSPFPGMNPYLEQADAWHDFHESFMPLAREVLSAQVDPRYIVKIDEQVYIHELSGEERRLLGRGDVFVARTPGSLPVQSATAVMEQLVPVRLLDVDMEGRSFLEIRDRHSREVITVIELLSPSNKLPGPDRGQYVSKRGHLLRSRAHFVEIDLLRGGPRMPLANVPPCDYCVLISRVEERPDAYLRPISLRERLPVISIPLRHPDPDATLDLQEILHRIYDAARYQTYIYSSEPEPPLSPEDAAWARQFVPVTA